MQLVSLFVAIVLLSSVADVVRAFSYEEKLMWCLKAATKNGDQGEGSFRANNIQDVLYGKIPYIGNSRLYVRTSLVKVSGLDKISIHNCSSKYSGPIEATTCTFVVENSSLMIIADIQPVFYNKTLYNDRIPDVLFKFAHNTTMSGHFTVQRLKKSFPANIPYLTEFSFDPMNFSYEKNIYILYTYIAEKLFIKHASSILFANRLSELVLYPFQNKINMLGYFTN